MFLGFKMYIIPFWDFQIYLKVVIQFISYKIQLCAQLVLTKGFIMIHAGMWQQETASDNLAFFFFLLFPFRSFYGVQIMPLDCVWIKDEFGVTLRSLPTHFPNYLLMVFWVSLCDTNSIGSWVKKKTSVHPRRCCLLQEVLAAAPPSREVDRYFFHQAESIAKIGWFFLGYLQIS